MMRTEDDVRAALATREELAPPAEAVLVGIRQRAARRRPARAMGVLATATLAVAAVAVPVLLLRAQPPAPHAAPSPAATSSVPGAAPVGSPVDSHAADRPDFFFTIAAGPVAGYEFRPSSVTPEYQSAVVVPAGGGEPVASVVLYRPGTDVRVPPDGFAEPDAQPNAQVNGSPAVVTVTAQGSGVQWPYAPDGVAVVHTAGATALPEPVLIEIAEAVRFVDPYPPRVPFRLDVVPAGLPLYNVAANGSTPEVVVQFISSSDDHPGALDITIPPPHLPGAQDWTWRPTTIAGRSARCAELIDGTRCEVAYGDVLVSIGSLTVGEIEQVVAGLHLADLADPTTWFDIDDAVPGL